MGQAPTFHPFNLSQGASSTEQVSAPVAPSPPVPGCSPRPKQQHPSPDPVNILPPCGTTSKASQEGPPNPKQWEITPLHKVLTWSCQETFSQDTSLVREVREEYLKRHFPNFTTENTCDLSDIFQHMAQTAKLLGLAIYEIKEVWWGQTSCGKLTMHWEPCWRTWDSLEWYPIRVPKSYGPDGHTWSRCTAPLQWDDPLPLVQEGGPKWGHNHQSPLDSTL